MPVGALRVAAAAGLVFVFGIAARADAQDLEPRAYGNTPVGLNFAIASYAYSAGGVATDPAIPLENADLEIHAALLAYARSLDVWGRAGKIDVVVPYAWLSGTADFAGLPRERQVGGFADLRVRASVLLYGAPALELAEFESYEQDLIVGLSFQLGAPFGQYDPDKLVNIGTNRWSFKPELGVSKTWGPVTLEVAPGVTLYTDNRDFLGGQTREQAPIFSVQAHLIYRWRYGIWLALDGTYYAGGRTTVEGVASDDRQGNSRFGATVALPVGRHHSLKLYGSTGTSTRTGSDFDTVGIAWQIRFGGGL
jgi:hypothetical protein